MVRLIVRMLRRIGAACLIFLCLLPAQTAAQGAWPRENGGWFVKAAFQRFASDDYVNLGGAELQTARFSQHMLNVYAEYGLADRWTLSLNWPGWKRQRFETTEVVQGIGDLQLGVKYALLRGKFPVALYLQPELPIGPNNLRAQNQENSFEFINLPTGDGEFNLWSGAVVSHSFHPFPAYANLSGSYNLRTSFQGTPFSDQVQGRLEVGAELWGRLWLRGSLSGLLSLGEASSIDFIRGEGTEYTSLGIGATWKVIGPWSLDLSYQTFLPGPVAPRNLYTGHILAAGVVFEWQPGQ